MIDARPGVDIRKDRSIARSSCAYINISGGSTTRMKEGDQQHHLPDRPTVLQLHTLVTIAQFFVSHLLFVLRLVLKPAPLA